MYQPITKQAADLYQSLASGEGKFFAEEEDESRREKVASFITD